MWGCVNSSLQLSSGSVATVSGGSNTVGAYGQKKGESGDKRVCWESLSVGGRCEHESAVISLEVGGEQLSRRHQLKRPVGETSFGAELQKGHNSK